LEVQMNAFQASGEALCMWVVFGCPRDFPEHIAVRRQAIFRSEIVHAPFAGLYESLEEARADLPAGLVCLPRFPEDDPAIVEVWL
jgi:hypothetical protein